MAGLVQGEVFMPTSVNADARLDRLPISSFHHRIFWLVGAGMFFDYLYVAGSLLAATISSKFSTARAKSAVHILGSSA
jgi:hypothetical protein